MRKIPLLIICILMLSVLSIGYAQVTDNLFILGTGSAQAPEYDVYISDVSPDQSGTVTVNNHIGTVLWASANGRGSASFEVTVVNQSDKSYVYERMLGGNEADLDDVYPGDGITSTVDGLVFLQEIAPGESLTFTLNMAVASGVVADNVYLCFRFIEKTGSEILPGGDSETETEIVTEPDSEIVTDPDTEAPPVPDTDPPATEPSESETEEVGNHFHSDMLGLSEALLSDARDCLNNNDVIWDAVQEAITTKHRPDNMPALIHCMVTSISGGNMVTITTNANQNLQGEVHFIIVADETDSNRLFLYMYYEEDCTDSAMGTQIMTYFQVLTRPDENGKWDQDGTYKGVATVASMWGGGNKNDWRLTIDPRTWIFAQSISEE